MATVWESRFGRQLSKLLGMKESTELTLLPDLMPSFPLFDAVSPAAFFMRDEQLFVCGNTQAAVAARFGRVRVNLPAAPANSLAEVYQAYIGNPTATGYTLKIDQLDGVLADPANTDIYMDARNTQGAGPIPYSATENLVALTGTYLGYVAANSGIILPVKAVLKGGSSLGIGANTVNLDIVVAFFGWYRSAGNAELQKVV